MGKKIPATTQRYLTRLWRICFKVAIYGYWHDFATMIAIKPICNMKNSIQYLSVVATRVKKLFKKKDIQQEYTLTEDFLFL
jgi:hypothetical protein